MTHNPRKHWPQAMAITRTQDNGGCVLGQCRLARAGGDRLQPHPRRRYLTDNTNLTNATTGTIRRKLVNLPPGSLPAPAKPNYIYPRTGHGEGPGRHCSGAPARRPAPPPSDQPADTGTTKDTVERHGHRGPALSRARHQNSGSIQNQHRQPPRPVDRRLAFCLRWGASPPGRL